MKKVGIYARVSTDEQAAVKEGGTKTQIDSLKKHIEGENHKEDGAWGTLVDVYVDDGFSAKNLKRPSLTRLLTDIAKKKVDTVLITEISRLSRSVKDWVHLREFFHDNSASFTSTRQHFDTSTATGRAMLDFAITFAQLEREQTSERVKANYHNRVSCGLWGGGPVPYGLELTDEAGHLELNEAKKIIADEILDILLNQAGSAARAVELITEAGFTREDGQNWDEKTLARWIRSRALIGETELNRKNKDKDQSTLREGDRYKTFKAVWEPVVDREKWQRANDLLDENYRKLKVAQWEHYEYILSGLLECEKGKPLVGSSGWGRSGDKYCSYRHRDSSVCDCGIKPVKAEEVEDLVLGELVNLVQKPEVLEQLVTSANQQFTKEQPDYSSALTSARRRLDGVNRRLNSILDQILEAMPEDKALWTDKKAALLMEKKSIEAEIHEIELRSKDQSFGKFDTDKMLDLLQTFNDGFDDLPVATKQGFLRAVIERIIVRPGEIEIILKNPGFPIGGGPGGRQKKSPGHHAVLGCESGDHFLAHSEKWGDRRGLNPRHSESQSDALPTELRPP